VPVLYTRVPEPTGSVPAARERGRGDARRQGVTRAGEAKRVAGRAMRRAGHGEDQAVPHDNGREGRRRSCRGGAPRLRGGAAGRSNARHPGALGFDRPS
jgi:hypothetical protein